jgi:ketosteroid isomerase-like protein
VGRAGGHEGGVVPGRPGELGDTGPVSETSEAVVRAALDTFESDGTIRPALLAETFAFDMSPYPGWTERQVYEGVEGLAEFIRVWVGAWDGYRFEVKEMEPIGDHVVVHVTQSGVARGSGLEVDMDFAQLWTARHGRIERVQIHPNVDSARAAAGA